MNKLQDMNKLQILKSFCKQLWLHSLYLQYMEIKIQINMSDTHFLALIYVCIQCQKGKHSGPGRMRALSTSNAVMTITECFSTEEEVVYYQKL